MSTTYDGNPANFPAFLTIPSDGDGPTIKAADVNVALEGLADRTANLDSRLAPVETGILLVNRKTYAGAILDLDIGTTSQTATVFSSGITTQVGDTIDVTLISSGSISYGSGATNGVTFRSELWASQNGGTFARIGVCTIGSQEAFTLDANNTSTAGVVAILGFITIATAGTLAVELRISFFGTPQSGDLASISPVASLLQYRSP